MDDNTRPPYIISEKTGKEVLNNQRLSTPFYFETRHTTLNYLEPQNRDGLVVKPSLSPTPLFDEEYIENERIKEEERQKKQAEQKQKQQIKEQEELVKRKEKERKQAEKRFRQEERRSNKKQSFSFLKRSEQNQILRSKR